MDDHAYASLPDTFLAVGVLAGFHDEGRRVARSIRGNMLSRLVHRAEEGERFSRELLSNDAVLTLKDEPRRSDILLSACIVVRKGEQISILTAGNYDVWCAGASGISQVVAGSSVYRSAASAGVAVEGRYKNICTAALSSDHQKSAIQHVDLVHSPTDTLMITIGDVEPEWVFERSRSLGRGLVVFAVDEGAEVRLTATFLCRR